MWRKRVSEAALMAALALMLTSVHIAIVHSSENEPETIQVGRYSLLSKPTIADDIAIQPAKDKVVPVYGPTQAGDTLSAIARILYPDDAFTLHQIVMALFERNPGAFEDRNVNQLKKGHLIFGPSDETLQGIDAETALRAYRRHDALWRKQVVSGKPGLTAAKAK